MDKKEWICPVCECNKQKGEGKYTAITKLFKNRKLIICERCNCKSIFPVIREEELMKYNSNYWGNVQSTTEISRKIQFAQALSRIEYLAIKIGEMTNFDILDVGAGEGHFFDSLKQKINNFNYYAIEVDKNIYPTLEKRGKVYGSLKDLKNQKFDLVILSHIIEHISKPREFLFEIKKLLKKDGYIFIEVPNRDDLHKKVLEPHLIVFEKKSLESLIGIVNMKIIDLTTVGESIRKLSQFKTLSSSFQKIIKKLLPDKIKKRMTSQICDFQIKRLKLNDYGGNRCWLRVIMKNN